MCAEYVASGCLAMSGASFSVRIGVWYLGQGGTSTVGIDTDASHQYSDTAPALYWDTVARTPDNLEVGSGGRAVTVVWMHA